jgi:hypothetical protein
MNLQRDEERVDPGEKAAEQLNLTDLLTNMLFVSNHQRKFKDAQLIDTHTFAGPCFNFEKLFPTSPFIFAVLSRVTINAEILYTEDAVKKLYREFPMVEHMKFKNYRLVGGACVSFLRTVRHQDRFTDDVDFFPLVERNGKSYHEVEAEINQIYVDFLEEVDTINRIHLKRNIYIYRGEDCTTIILGNHDEQPDRGTSFIKIQFVHRVFHSEAQMLLSSDLMPSQVLFNGKKFLCTYAAMCSLKTGIIPVDCSSASTSMGSRLNKYACKKDFYLAFCGLDRTSILELAETKDELARKKRDMTRKGGKLTRKAVTVEKKHQEWLEGCIVLPMGVCLSFGFGDTGIMTPLVPDSARDGDEFGENIEIACYYDHELSGNENVEYLMSTNIENIIKDRRVCVAAKSVDSFLKGFYLEADVRRVFSLMVDHKLNLKREEMSFLFGSYALEAATAYFSNNLKEYYNVAHRRGTELDGLIAKKLDELKVIKWRTVDPGAQTHGSMHPIKMTARQAYGKYYNPFHCTYMWEQKMTIISAFRGGKKKEPDCLFTLLPKDILKRIFFLLDCNYSSQIESFYFDVLTAPIAENLQEERNDWNLDEGFDRFDQHNAYVEGQAYHADDFGDHISDDELDYFHYLDREVVRDNQRETEERENEEEQNAIELAIQNRE